MLVVALLAAVPAVASQPATVPALLAHVHDWDGRTVAVRGWVHGCDSHLARRCYVTPEPSRRIGRRRLALVASDHLTGSLEPSSIVRVVVRGTVQEHKCPAGDICLDGEDDLRVDFIEQVGKPRR